MSQEELWIMESLPSKTKKFQLIWIFSTLSKLVEDQDSHTWEEDTRLNTNIIGFKPVNLIKIN